MPTPTYDKEAVIADITAKVLKPQQIADKYGITVDSVYAIKSQAKKAGLINSRGYKTIDERIKDEAAIDPGLRVRIKDMREMDLTTTEIADLLQKEGIKITRDDVAKVMARGANDYADNRPSSHPGGKVRG